MKRWIQIGALSVVCFIIIQQIDQQHAYSNINGAIPKVTGSPHDNQTCSQTMCHTGPVTTIDDIITSNVPVSGYTPGTTYMITATVSSPYHTRFGFEISPQNLNGDSLGTIIITDFTRTHFTFPALGNKYITHTIAGTDAPSHTSTWSFNWHAPVEGTGDVTFYGAFNFTNRDSTVNGDSIHTSTMVIPENTDGIDAPLVISSLKLYPNPAVNAVQLDYYLQKSGVVYIDLIDESGKLIKSLFSAQQSSGAHHDSFSLSPDVAKGVYVVELRSGSQSLMRKLVIL